MNKDSIQLFSLTQPQQRIWYSELLYPNTGVSTISLTIKMKGNIRLNALQQALNMVIRQYDAFRIRITAKNGYPQQYVEEHIDKTFECLDFSSADGEAQALERLDHHNRTPFELFHSDLYQFIICKISDQEYWYNVKIHHIVTDGISARMLINQVNEYYSDITNGTILEISENHSYFEFIQTEQDYEESDRYQKDRAYWLDKFRTLPEVIGAKSYNPLTLSTAGKRKNIILEDSMYNNLQEVCKQTNSSMLTVFMAAIYIYMHKKTTLNDVSIGTFYANRTTKKEKEMIGMFVSTVPTRVFVDPDMDLLSFLQVVSKEQVSILRHQRFPYNKIMEDLRETHQHKDLQRLFGVSVQYRPMNYLQYENAEIEVNENFCGDVINDFEMNVIDGVDNQKILFQLNYRAQLFTEEEIEQLVHQFFTIIETIIHHPISKIADISLLREEEKNNILSVFNNTLADYPREKLIHQLFEEQAARTPEQVAVICEGEQLTYRELNERANQLARKLRAEGVEADQLVGIMTERSLEMMVGIFGILKAGGAYVPIDPEFPEERIRYMLEDSEAKLLLVQHHLLDRVPFAGKMVDINDAENYCQEGSNLEAVNGPNHLAYVIYTSGSTGKPKGVMIEHHSVINRLMWMQTKYPISATDTILQKTAITFDVSVWELFWWSMVGSKVCLLSIGGEKNPERILETIAEHSITTMHFVPAMLHAFLDHVEQQPSEIVKAKLGSLRQVFASGEALPPQHVDRFQRAVSSVSQARLINLYGPTEATVDVTYFDCHADEQLAIIPIGKPIFNTQLYILQADSEYLQPIGIAGELCITGVGLARGYLNRPELTEEKFVQNPFVPGERMYRTGDLARWLPDGNIEYLGRIDHQVKIRGYRIELGEVELQLLKLEAIQEAVVIAREDANGQKQMCAYFIANKQLTVGEIRAELSQELPTYMVPSYFVQLDKMPLSPNGKIDRKMLPAPEESIQTGVEYVAPRTAMEQTLVSIWQAVLGAKKISVLDNFFDLGGDSIKSIQISSRMLQAGYKLEMKDLFTYPTIAQLSRHIQLITKVADQGEVVGAALLTPIQHWFFEQKLVEQHHYNQAFMLFMKKGFDETALRKVIQKIAIHHDALRIAVRESDSGYETWYRGIEEGELYSLEVIDLRGETDCTQTIETKVNEIQSSIALTEGPLIKLGLFQCQEGDHLLIVIHHVAVDGVSWRILFEDIASGYEQALKGEAISFPQKTDSFQKWAEELSLYADSEELQKEKSYWQQIEQIDKTDLPKDFIQEQSVIGESQIVAVQWTDQETEQLLKQANRAYSTEVNDLLLTALGMAIHDWTGTEQVLVNVEGHGRESIIQDIDVTRTVGWFTSLYPVVLQMGTDQGVSQRIKQVKEMMRQIPHKGLVMVFYAT
nr:amino acid adenylation domain-containing protein [Brevibacillus laterosporus]